jgi:hypothetical protein
MSEAAAAAAQSSASRELYVRHARIDGCSVARLRAVDEGDRCVVEAEVWPSGTSATSIAAGPFSFPSPVEATRFVTHAVEAFIALGCDVAAS